MVISLMAFVTSAEIYENLIPSSCTTNSDCNDNDCTQCSLSKLVTVKIMTDNHPEETSWEIINYETNDEVMTTKTKTYTDSNQLYIKNQCLGEGAYLFIIHDSGNDGISGEGRYEVTAGDKRKMIGGDFKQSRAHFFLIGDKHSRLRGTANIA